MFEKTVLTDGSHTIKLIVKGQRNSNSTANYITVDAFETLNPISPEQASVTVGQNAIEDSNTTSLSYSGSWSHAANSASGYSSDSLSFSATTNNYVNYTFTGTSIKWIGSLNANVGYADVYIDNVYQTTVDGYAPTEHVKVKMFEKADLIRGSHTIKLVVKGLRNPSSTANYITVDAFEALNPVNIVSPAQTSVSIGQNAIEDSDTTTISYSGSWVHSLNNTSGYSSDSLSFSATTDDSVSYTFTGTSIKWIGSLFTNVGFADVYIDNVYQATIDGYASPEYVKVKMFEKTGLTIGSHTIKLVVKGEKNSNSTANYITVDAFEAN